MKSNISLKSNVYLSNDKYIVYDNRFLSKIQSPKKMSQIREGKYILLSLPRYWSQVQQKYFISKKNNPYSGILMKDTEYVFIDNVVIPEDNFIEYDSFEYDYTYSLRNYKLNELLIKNIVSFDYDSINDVVITQEITGKDTPSVGEIKFENIFSVISEAKKEEDIFDETDNENENFQLNGYPEQCIQDEDNNIFSRFAETDQNSIIEAVPENIFFVDAGPGTGKTFTLIQKIQYLVTKYNIPADTIIVLCFTNAAVNEIKERLNNAIKSGCDRGVANVDVRTFHSFSWWLINQANEFGWRKTNLHNITYDQSIKKASEIMSIRNFYKQIVGNWRHFIVDEIQDLTNHLARFVLYIVNACLDNNNIGITVLGDSCQAIYDYTLKDEKQIPMGSQDFYNALTRKIDQVGLFHKLSKNHRQVGSLSDFSSDYRNTILSLNIHRMQNEVDNISKKINKIDGDIISIIDENMLSNINSNNNDERICFACRNNGQTLKLSSIFRKKRIKHNLNVNTTENNYAAWISEIFYGFKKVSIDYNEFIDRFNKLVSYKTWLNPEEIWDKLNNQAKLTDSKYISEIIKNIGTSKKDDVSFRHTEQCNILVSNIHRTKGREYEHIVLDHNFIDDLTERQQDIGEYKTLYVALTRSKKSLYSARLTEHRKKGGVYPITVFKTKRRRYGRMKSNKVLYFELIGDLDISIDSYLSDKIQTYIKNINVGDPILLKRTKDNDRIFYNVIHAYEDVPTIIGQLNDTFKDDLIARMNLSEQDYIMLPAVITDLYVSGKYTHIATKDYLEIHPEIKKRSPNGIWQWVEFIGIGYATYDIY